MYDDVAGGDRCGLNLGIHCSWNRVKDCSSTASIACTESSTGSSADLRSACRSLLVAVAVAEMTAMPHLVALGGGLQHWTLRCVKRTLPPD